MNDVSCVTALCYTCWAWYTFNGNLQRNKKFYGIFKMWNKILNFRI